MFNHPNFTGLNTVVDSTNFGRLTSTRGMRHAEWSSRGQVALDVQRRAGSLLEGRAELVSDDCSQRGLAQAWRAVK